MFADIFGLGHDEATEMMGAHVHAEEVPGCRGPDGAFASLTTTSKLIQEGQIQVSSVQAFAGSLVDGFDQAHWVSTAFDVRQVRRADCYRVETSANTAILVSADIFDNGNVKLYES